MNVYLNEKCLETCKEVNFVPQFLSESFSLFEKKRINIYTRFNEIESWFNYWEPCFDATLKAFTIQLFRCFEDCQVTNREYYYYYFKHQDFGLSLGENISHFSLSDATDKILSGQDTIVLNLPDNNFCKRPFLPILKSPYDNKLKDELANIPCFDDAKKIIQYILLHEKIKPLINDEVEFEKFKNDYLIFLDKFDFSAWKPKTFSKDNVLNLKIVFPAINYKAIKNNLLKWKITKKSYEDNIVSYKELGGIILELHGYTKNFQLTSHYVYDIYEAGYGNSKLLISIDTENGAFELIENDGTHIGEYGNDGVYKPNKNKKDINSHSLIDIPEHMFIFK
ncbi:MAG: hypothetical protein A2046_07720 [Bacteroidetes bacterium GWA2_30_7]|nr:MAG: hypothetical protein A2046_07720 [Bacteroidetes bacterium GWA2_30_7]